MQDELGKNIVACKIGNHNVTEYINAFRKYLVLN